MAKKKQNSKSFEQGLWKANDTHRDLKANLVIANPLLMPVIGAENYLEMI